MHNIPHNFELDVLFSSIQVRTKRSVTQCGHVYRLNRKGKTGPLRHPLVQISANTLTHPMSRATCVQECMRFTALHFIHKELKEKLRSAPAQETLTEERV